MARNLKLYVARTRMESLVGQVHGGSLCVRFKIQIHVLVSFVRPTNSELQHNKIAETS